MSGDLDRAPQRGRANGHWNADVTPGWPGGSSASRGPVRVQRTDTVDSGAPWSTVATSGARGRNADGEVARREHEPPRDARGRARSVDAPRLHELAHDRSAPPSDRAASTRRPRRRRCERRPADRGLAGGDIRELPRLPVLPGLPAPRARPQATRAGRQGRPLRRLPRRAPRPSRRHAGDDHRVRVPSSIGSAHEGPLGRDQGEHSEQEAISIDAQPSA